MALLSKKQFADRCGMATKKLSVYIQRKKVVSTDDGMVDDENPFNMLFLQQKQGKTVSAQPKEKRTPAKSTKQLKLEEMAFTLEKDRKDLDMETKRNAIKLQQIEIAKKQGELVPTSLIKELMIIQAEAMRLHYNEATETLIVIYNAKLKLSNEQAADIRSKMDVNINTAIDKIVETSKRKLRNLAIEYSERRGVGQHD